jgi:hypothetical protein
VSEQQPSKPHLSASQLEMFAKCPESWRRRYLEKEVIPPRLAMLKGSAVHEGAEVNMRQKIESRQDLPSDEIVEAAVNAYDSRVKADGYSLAEGEAKAEVSRYKDVVAQMAEVHAVQQAPDYQPIAVEQKFRLELPAITHDIVGVIDLIDESGAVVDFKTAGKKMSEVDVETSTQLTLYAASRTDEEVNVRLDVLVEPSARLPVRRQVIEATRNRTDLPIIARRLTVVSKTIDAGLFPPAPVGSWWCSESWCGYWHSCPYVNADRIAASKQVKLAIKILQGE